MLHPSTRIYFHIISYPRTASTGHLTRGPAILHFVQDLVSLPNGLHWPFSQGVCHPQRSEGSPFHYSVVEGRCKYEVDMLAAAFLVSICVHESRPLAAPSL